MRRKRNRTSRRNRNSIGIEIESRSEIWSEIESTILNSFFYDEIGNEIESMTSTEIVFAF